MSGPLTYVAIPYSCNALTPISQHRTKERRFQIATIAAAMLAKCKGWNPFSPITHSHPMHVMGGLDGDWSFWCKIDTEYLQCSQRMVIVMEDGWEKSTGVTAETGIAQNLGLPLLRMTVPILSAGVWYSTLTDKDGVSEQLSYEPAR